VGEVLKAAKFSFGVRLDSGQNLEETAKQFHVAPHANKPRRQVNRHRPLRPPNRRS
jgi:hypothetical protein